MIAKDTFAVLVCRRGVEGRGHNCVFSQGGRVDKGESFEDAACREMWEEAGVLISASNLIRVSTFVQGQKAFINYIVLVDSEESCVVHGPPPKHAWEVVDVTHILGSAVLLAPDGHRTGLAWVHIDTILGDKEVSGFKRLLIDVKTKLLEIVAAAAPSRTSLLIKEGKGKVIGGGDSHSDMTTQGKPVAKDHNHFPPPSTNPKADAVTASSAAAPWISPHLRTTAGNNSSPAWATGAGVAAAVEAVAVAVAVPQPEPSFSFFAIGDFGEANRHSLTVAKSMDSLAQQRTPRFVIGLGDNIYERGVTSVDSKLFHTQWADVFIRPFPSLRVPWMIALGNHDYYGNTDAQIDFTRHATNPFGLWQCPDRNYSFATDMFGSPMPGQVQAHALSQAQAELRPSVEFFCLDTNG